MKHKFRAWDNENNKYFEPTYKAYKGKVEELMINMNGRIIMRTLYQVIDESVFPNRFIIEWFTGEYDRNSKEIYEGDIIKETFETCDNEMLEVIFDTKEAMFGVLAIDYKSTLVLLTDVVNGEVIGNIHEGDK